METARGNGRKKFNLQGLKMVFWHKVRLQMDKIGRKVDQKGPKIVFVVAKMLQNTHFRRK